MSTRPLAWRLVTRWTSDSALPLRRCFASTTTCAVALHRVPSNDKIPSGVWVVSLNRPDKLNALSVDVSHEFAAVMRRLNDISEKDLRCVVLVGRGKGFCAGGDLTFLEARHADSEANNVVEMNTFYRRFLGSNDESIMVPGLRTLPVPVVCGVHGSAVGKSRSKGRWRAVAGACVTNATE